MSDTYVTEQWWVDKRQKQLNELQRLRRHFNFVNVGDVMIITSAYELWYKSAVGGMYLFDVGEQVLVTKVFNENQENWISVDSIPAGVGCGFVPADLLDFA